MPDGSAFPDNKEIPDKNSYTPVPDKSFPNREKPDTTIHQEIPDKTIHVPIPDRSGPNREKPDTRII